MKFLLKLSLAASLLVAPWRNACCAETDHDFAQWENEISAFEQMDKTNPPPKSAILFVGSSTIVRWNTLAQDFPGQPVINRGFGGSELCDATHFADRIIFPYAPRKIFLRAGGNDIANGKSPEQVFADFQEFAALVHAKLPDTTIYFISWSPCPLRWKQHESEIALNTMVADFTRQKTWLKYIEAYDLMIDAKGKPKRELFAEDKLHLSPAGYQLLADRIRPFVMDSTIKPDTGK